jgi:hypothetical protein
MFKTGQQQYKYSGEKDFCEQFSVILDAAKHFELLSLCPLLRWEIYFTKGTVFLIMQSRQGVLRALFQDVYSCLFKKLPTVS